MWVGNRLGAVQCWTGSYFAAPTPLRLQMLAVLMSTTSAISTAVSHRTAEQPAACHAHCTLYTTRYTLQTATRPETRASMCNLDIDPSCVCKSMHKRTKVWRCYSTCNLMLQKQYASGGCSAGILLSDACCGVKHIASRTSNWPQEPHI